MDPTSDQMISVGLVSGLLMLSAVRGMLNRTGLIAATIVGLTVSLFGHWTWLAILISFLAVGSLATLWKYEEKAALRLAEENKGARGWRNVMANGGVASLSLTGTFAALGGALLIALLSVSLASITDVEIPLLTMMVVVTSIGWLGCQVDSILGALFENKGLIGKHTVNFLATLSGALMAIFFHIRFL